MDGVSETETSLQSRLVNVRYADKEYWNTRYKSQPCEFDWFYGYTALRKIVRTFVKRSKPVLHVGCGNSNFQEGMAKDGYQVMNTDISDVVIEQMREKHRNVPNLRYVVSDCRSMPEFMDFEYGSVIDKGTVDALLCSTHAAEDIRSMFLEISRVLVPGGVFLLVTLGGPAQRLALVNRPEFGWSVQVCLVRRIPEDQYAPSAPGRTIPLNDTVRPLSVRGPLEVSPDGTIAGLPEPFEPSSYFYAYACRKAPLLLQPDNKGGKGGKVRMPEGWKAMVRAVAQVVGGLRGCRRASSTAGAESTPPAGPPLSGSSWSGSLSSSARGRPWRRERRLSVAYCKAAMKRMKCWRGREFGRRSRFGRRPPPRIWTSGTSRGRRTARCGSGCCWTLWRRRAMRRGPRCGPRLGRTAMVFRCAGQMRRCPRTASARGRTQRFPAPTAAAAQHWLVQAARRALMASASGRRRFGLPSPGRRLGASATGASPTRSRMHLRVWMPWMARPATATAATLWTSGRGTTNPRPELRAPRNCR